MLTTNHHTRKPTSSRPLRQLLLSSLNANPGYVFYHHAEWKEKESANEILVQFSPFKMLCLGFIGMDCVISKPCRKGTIFKGNIGKLPFMVIFL